MTNILIIYEVEEPCNIETRRVFKMLEAKNLLQCKGVFATHVDKSDLVWADVLVFVRSTSSIERDLVSLAKEMGKFVILSLDDDFLGLDSSYGADGSGYRRERHDCLKSILYNVDCLLAVNKLLAQKYIKYCISNRYVLTNTMVERSEFYQPQMCGISKEKIKLAIYVNDGTQEIFNQILRPAFQLLKEYYHGRVAIYLMALHPDMSEFEHDFDIHYIPHMPYAEFKHYMGTEDFDIGLAPLDNEGFSKYKYFNKYIEYTLAGIPAIYSDCPLYRLVIRDGYNGIFTDNSPEGWFREISRMIEEDDLRKDIIKNAQVHLYDNFESDVVLERLVQNIPELIGFKSPEASVGMLLLKLCSIKLNYRLFRIRGWIGTAGLMIRKGNIGDLCKRFKKRILKM